MIETLERKCHACGIALQGRSDKKFCSDQCRSSHYNRVNHGSSAHVRYINNRLRKNWRILHELYSRGLEPVTEDTLLMLGFDFNHFTSLRNMEAGDPHYYCYDLGYARTAQNQITLVARRF